MTPKYKRKEVTIMQAIVREHLEMAKVGRKQVYKNMAVFPLLSDYCLSSDYILLDEASGSGLIEVTENIDDDYRGRMAIVSGMEKDCPHRPIVQRVSIAWIVEVEMN
jgi:hypothetical protein